MNIEVSIGVDISVIGEYVVGDGFRLKTAVVVAVAGCVEILSLTF